MIVRIPFSMPHRNANRVITTTFRQQPGQEEGVQLRLRLASRRPRLARVSRVEQERGKHATASHRAQLWMI